MIPGQNQQANRPGSYVLVMKTYQDNPKDPGHWQRKFFCEENGWVSPNGYWQIVYVEPNAANGGAGECYIDWGPNNSNGDYDLCAYDDKSSTWSASGNGKQACTYTCDNTQKSGFEERH